MEKSKEIQYQKDIYQMESELYEIQSMLNKHQVMLNEMNPQPNQGRKKAFTIGNKRGTAPATALSSTYSSVN